MHKILVVVFTLVVGLTTSARAADVVKPAIPQTVTYRVIGLFSPERETALREFTELMADVKLDSIDYAAGEATFTFDAEKLLGKLKPEQVIERFDNLLRVNSFSTFSVLPRSTVPKAKLKQIEVEVVGLDCPGCSLAAYESVAKLPGVERATASFKAGLVTAWIDPTVTDRATLEAALVKKGVELKTPPAK